MVEPLILRCDNVRVGLVGFATEYIFIGGVLCRGKLGDFGCDWLSIRPSRGLG